MTGMHSDDLSLQLCNHCNRYESMNKIIYGLITMVKHYVDTTEHRTNFRLRCPTEHWVHTCGYVTH
jgi:DNA phosphorothioation-dependent restriction protein DptG